MTCNSRTEAGATPSPRIRSDRLAGRLMLTLCVLVIGLIGSPSALASGHCHRFSPNQPCLRSIVSEYNYEDRFSGGETWLLKATFGPKHAIDEAHPFNTQRNVTWRTAKGVKLVAAFVVTRTNTPKLRFHYKRIPTGPHSGHVTLTSITVDHLSTAPLLLLEGEKTASVAIASKHCTSFTSETPCLGPIQTLFGFPGMAGGAVHSITVKRGPEEEVGKNPEGVPIERRRFTWHAVAGVKLVAAFVLTPLSKNGQRCRTTVHPGRYAVDDPPKLSPYPDRFPPPAKAPHSRLSCWWRARGNTAPQTGG